MTGKADLRVVGDGAAVDERAAALGLGPEAGYDDWLRIGSELAARHGSTTP